MELLRDWDAWRRLIGAVPRDTKTYTTNLYATREQIEGWCADGRLCALSTGQAVLLLRADRSFHHIHHVARDLTALANALGALHAGTYTADIVGQGEQLDEVCATYAASGFAVHTFLQRMVHVGRLEAAREDDATIAAPEEAAEVVALLERLLDRFAEQAPEVVALQQEARDGRLLIVRRDGVIVGMLLYEIKGRMAHLRLWHVDDTARGQGMGHRLMRSFLARCAQAQVQRVVLWVIGDNVQSIAIYRHYGFVPDGLLDRIMIRREGPHR
ncbi:GNAT family N-acetyltransferase [Methylorubrum extorquens]|uniref:GNAT family N-acetyltransferase n=1 Tax=Methylorubrum extorquens TaxID=408 RepID=UPI001EE59428|nr:GNAT family N-acetyltransferase [Methylorubrum extorquens]MCG5244941.1 GNAT family N-acetyltransferase [Methylorubrum extorquens]